MDADQKLTSLKKAYADMILHTSTEAAARILASERKARRLELELKQSKEDALQMLTRLKKMMDSKIREAEMASRAQQKKIQELEAQLQEAEDIVKDLREELTVVHAELERVSPRKEVTPMVQVNEASEKNLFSNPGGIAFPPPKEQPDIGSSDKDQNNIGQRLYNSLFPFRKSYIDDQDLPSIILRSKGTKLYRSGSTQRIRACERTLLDRELSLPKQKNHIEPDLVTIADEGGKLHKVPSLGDERKKRRKRTNPNRKKRISCPNRLLDQEKEMDHVAANSYLTTSRSVKCSIGENPNESINTDAGLVRVGDVHNRIGEELQLLECGKPELPPSSEAQVDHPESKALATGEFPIKQKNHIKPDLITRADEDGKLHKVHSLADERKKRRKRTNPDWKKRTSRPNRLLGQVKERDHVVNNSYLTTSRSVKRSIGENPDESINTDTGLVRASDVHNRLGEELQLVGCEKPELPPSSEAQVDPPESKALATGGFPIEPTNSRVFKYTFQRKRKRGTLSSDGSDLHKKKEENKSALLETEKVISMEEAAQEGTEKVMSIEVSSEEETEKVISIEEAAQEGTEKVISIEESSVEETEKFISVEESTQEESHLEQVAQQLIYLSEKKWRQ